MLEQLARRVEHAGAADGRVGDLVPRDAGVARDLLGDRADLGDERVGVLRLGALVAARLDLAR